MDRPLLSSARRLLNGYRSAGDRATMADVCACYRLLLDREPDADGLQHYKGLIRASSLSVAGLFELFVRSPEFEARLDRLYAWTARQPELVELRDGSSLYVAASGDPDISGAIRTDRQYEPEVTAALQTSLRPGDCFVDVGASIGYFTVLAAQAVGAAGRVVACEPGPQNQSILLLNVASRGLSNVELLPYAISDRREIVAYTRLASNGAISPLVGPASMATGDLVQSIPLDELAAGVPRIDVVKIDVEGAEGKVLAGAQQLLQRFRPTLFFEFTPGSLEEVSGTTGDELLSVLEDLGYHFAVLSGKEVEEKPAFTTASGVIHKFAALKRRHIDVMATQS